MPGAPAVAIIMEAGSSVVILTFLILFHLNDTAVDSDTKLYTEFLISIVPFCQ